MAIIPEAGEGESNFEGEQLIGLLDHPLRYDSLIEG